MFKKIKIFIIASIFIGSSHTICMQYSPYTITFFLRPYSEESANQNISNLKNPTKTAIKSIFNNIHPKVPTPSVGWVYSAYNGYVTISDINGEVTFPRKTVGLKFNLLITEEIEPILVKPTQRSIIEGFVVEPNVSYKYYSLESRPTQGKTYEWIIKEATLPKNGKVPFNTIFIFLSPKNVVMPSNSSTIKLDGNLLLPDIYIKGSPNKSLSAIRFLPIRQYFSRVKKRYEFKPELYQERIA